MTVHVVRVLYIVHLEAERMLQVVARLLAGQPGHGGSPLAIGRVEPTGTNAATRAAIQSQPPHGLLWPSRECRHR